MNLQQMCRECVHMIRIGDTDTGMNIILTCMPQIQMRMQQVLETDSLTDTSQENNRQADIVKRLEMMVRCIENRDGVGLADVLEYEMKEMLG